MPRALPEKFDTLRDWREIRILGGTRRSFRHIEARCVVRERDIPPGHLPRMEGGSHH